MYTYLHLIRSRQFKIKPKIDIDQYFVSMHINYASNFSAHVKLSREKRADAAHTQTYANFFSFNLLKQFQFDLSLYICACIDKYTVS